MAATGGSIVNVSLRGRNFAVAADADANRDLGGWANEVQANGDGSARKIMTRKPWTVGGLTLSIDDDNNDQEFLQEIADLKGWVAITIELAGGAVYQGQGTIADTLETSTQNTTAGVTLSGPQKLEAQ